MKPGDVVPCWGDFAPYAVVLATSRHKATVAPADAREILAATLGAEEWNLTATSVMEWRTHTKRYLDAYGCECDGHPEGGWCYEGDGKAWVRVLVGQADDTLEMEA